MSKKIAILRGINVGGRRKILMADLKILFGKLGFKEVMTYIQSGNIVFNEPTYRDDKEIAGLIKNSILESFDFDVPVIVRSVAELRKAISDNPFYKTSTEIERLHLTFLEDKPSKEQLEIIKSFVYTPDKFEIVGKNVFVFCSGKYSVSKLSNTFFENKLKVAATTRNWKTVLKLLELSV